MPAEYEPSAHEVRTVLIHLAREHQLDRPVQVACDAQTLLDTHLTPQETMDLLGWDRKHLQTALELADVYVWSTYDTEDSQQESLESAGGSEVLEDTVDIPEEHLADVEKIPRRLPIERIFEGVIAPEDVESLMSLPDPQYQEVIRFFRLLLDMTQDERVTPSIELMAPLILWMRGLRMNEVAGTLGLSRHVLRGNMDIFRELAGRYNADIFDLLVSLEHDMKQPQVILASPAEAVIDTELPEDVDSGAWAQAEDRLVVAVEASGQDPDPSIVRRALYKVAAMSAPPDEEIVLIDEAELTVEVVHASDSDEESELSQPEQEESHVDEVITVAPEMSVPRKVTSVEVTETYLEELGLDLGVVLDARAKDFNAEAIEVIKILRDAIVAMREWHKTVLCLNDEEHRRLNTLLGIDTHRTSRGLYEVSPSRLGPKTLSFIRRAAANGRRSTSDDAQDAINSALLKLQAYLSEQKNERAS